MNVVIRADSSIEVGTGHIMRCLTLAKQLKRHGAKVTFVCRAFDGDSISYIRDEGIQVIVLPAINGRLEWQVDAMETISSIREVTGSVDLLIVDHYELDKQWEKEIRPYVKKIMVIDDLADRPHDCDLLLDQNYYPDMDNRYKDLVPNHCIQMIGPNYVLLRDEFLLAIDKPRKRTGEIKNILVFFGGTDPTGETIKTLHAIEHTVISEIVINVVVGQSNPNRLRVEQMCSALPNVNFHCQVNNMAELMDAADLAIGAGGSTTWERCLLQLPSMTVVLAENQFELTKTMSSLGATINLGNNLKMTAEDYQNSISDLIQKPDKVKRMIKNCEDVMNRQIIKENPVVSEIRGLLT